MGAMARAGGGVGAVLKRSCKGDEEIIYPWGSMEKGPWAVASSSKQPPPFMPACPTNILSGCLDLEKMGKHRPEVKMSRRYQGEGREKHSKVKEQLYEGQGHATALLLRETLSGEAEIHEVCEGAVGK